MATRYDALTTEQKEALYTVPSEVMKDMTLVQHLTYPIRAIKAGMVADKTPEQIGEDCYNEIIGCPVGRFDDVERGTLRNIATFMGHAVAKKLTDLIGVVVTKITPVIDTVIAATNVTAGATLSTSTLSGTFKVSDVDATAVPGTLAWTDDTQIVNATGDYGWTFTPTDTATYEVVTGTITVTVA